MDGAIELDEALKAAGYGKFNVALLIVCGGCLFSSTLDSYSIGYIIPTAQCDLNLDIFEKGILTSMSLFGSICSSHVWGYVVDKKGRRDVIIASMFVTFLCTLASSFSVNFAMFVILRFLTGVFGCCSGSTIWAYLGEFHAVKHRTISIAVVSLFVALGMLIIPTLAWCVLPLAINQDILGLPFKAWRLFLLLCSIPWLITSIFMMLFPESPKYLIAQRKKSEALGVLKKMYSYNTGNGPCDFPVKDLKIEESKLLEVEANLLKSMWYQTKPLFTKPYAFSTHIVCLLQFGLYAISSGMLMWYPEVINQVAKHARSSGGLQITVCEVISLVNKVTDNNTAIVCTDTIDDSVFQQNVFLGATYAIGYIFIALTINELGKRTILVSLLLMSGLSGLALHWVTDPNYVNVLFIGLLVLSGLCCAIVNAAAVEIYPTYLRATAMCISTMIGRIGSVLSSFTIGIFLEVNCTITFLTFVNIVFGCAFLSLFIPNQPDISKNDNQRKRYQICKTLCYILPNYLNKSQRKR